ncbi:MAG: EamA family transporter [Gammaproteobacteria bacterium]|nr:EamA family transporter [Gammaproteobacteria bacterium]
MQTALILIGLSVLMHVSWNIMARHVDKKADYLWWGLLGHFILLGPVAVYGLWCDTHWNSTLIIAMMVTLVANSGYFISLRKAYHFAPIAVVYPLARSSPLLIAIWSILLFGEQIGLLAWLAISITVVGLAWLAYTARSGDTRHALPWAISATLFTSIYSLSDKVAVDYLPTFPALIGFVSVGYFGAFVALSIHNIHHIGRVVPLSRPDIKYLIPGGLFIGTAYALVIQAMQYLPAAYVVTFTNAGIVLANILGIVLLKETLHWQQRLLASVVISLGLVILSLGSV